MFKLNYKHQTLQWIKGSQRTSCSNLVLWKVWQVFFTFTSFFLRDGWLSSSSKLEIFAVKIGSATDLSVLRWRIFTFFQFCNNNKTSILCKNNQSELWTHLVLMQSISSTLGNLLAITSAAAMILSSISSAFIPVWPIRAVLKEMKSKIDLWANKHTSRYLFSGILKEKKKATKPTHLSATVLSS